MSIKQRIKTLEKQVLSDDNIVFIDAKNTIDFREQIRTLIREGLDPEGKKFVYVEDPLCRMLREIDGTSRGLPGERFPDKYKK